jgi:hypothetical protein
VQLFLTAVDAWTGAGRDLTIDAEDDTTIADLATVLASPAGSPALASSGDA